jgi:hypothetical protein
MYLGSTEFSSLINKVSAPMTIFGSSTSIVAVSPALTPDRTTKTSPIRGKISVEDNIEVRIQVIQKAVNPLLCKHLGELWTNAHSH